MVRVRLWLGVALMAAGLVWGTLGPTLGAPYGYYGWHDGVRTERRGGACTWCKNWRNPLDLATRPAVVLSHVAGRGV